MNEAVYERFARAFLSGFFEAVRGATSTPVTNAVGSLAPVGIAELEKYLSRFNALIRVRVESGGSIAIALAGTDANRLVASALGRVSLDDSSIAGHDPEELSEVFDRFLKGGIAQLREQYGEEIVLHQAEVRPSGPDIAAGLYQVLGHGCVAADFSYCLGDGHDAAGVLMFSRSIGEIVELHARLQGGITVAESTSQDEIGALTESTIPNDQTAAASSAQEKNMEMVLDIQLTVTARLGRIEMPIGDILGLGPGSIIEVGHLVDEPVELLVNDKLIARGDVVVVDEKFGLRITEIISTRERIESLR